MQPHDIERALYVMQLCAEMGIEPPDTDEALALVRSMRQLEHREQKEAVVRHVFGQRARVQPNGRQLSA
jgi:hypothetical protein